MSTTSLVNQTDSSSTTAEFCKEVYRTLRSPQCAADGSEQELQLIQKIREKTISGEVEPQSLMTNLLMLYCKGMSTMCDQHEANMSLKHPYPIGKYVC